MRLAILGGSFNPIHLGHFFLADTVLSTLPYDRVILVPAFRSPFKPEAKGMETSAGDRLEMIAASIAGDHRLTVDGCEIIRGGVSYTVDTVEDIIRKYVPDGKPGLIIGDDLAAEFPKWRKFENILDMADIIIARRCNGLYSSEREPAVSYPHICINNDVMDISSAAVREKIAEGKAWRSLVPPAARLIIEDRKMYGFRQVDTESCNSYIPSKKLIVRVEDLARETLSFERFLHSRNVALFARDLCSRLMPSIDPETGYLAGIAHDLGKHLKAGELLKLAEKDGNKITRLEKDKPSLLHGRASAVILKERFNVFDEAVLEAVALHTSGAENMGPLAKIVYIADKMEFSRENVDTASRKLAYSDNNLDKIFLTALNWSVARIKAKKQELSDETVRLLEKMQVLCGIERKT